MSFWNRLTNDEAGGLRNIPMRVKAQQLHDPGLSASLGDSSARDGCLGPSAPRPRSRPNVSGVAGNLIIPAEPFPHVVPLPSTSTPTENLQDEILYQMNLAVCA